MKTHFLTLVSVNKDPYVQIFLLKSVVQNKPMQGETKSSRISRLAVFQLLIYSNSSDRLTYMLSDLLLGILLWS